MPIPLIKSDTPLAADSLVESLVGILEQIRTVRIPAELPLPEVSKSCRSNSLPDRLPHFTAALEQCQGAFRCYQVLTAFQSDMLSAKPYTGSRSAAHGDPQAANLIIAPGDPTRKLYQDDVPMRVSQALSTGPACLSEIQQ